jgi:hypothetical protein
MGNLVVLEDHYWLALSRSQDHVRKGGSEWEWLESRLVGEVEKTRNLGIQCFLPFLRKEGPRPFAGCEGFQSTRADLLAMQVMVEKAR